MSKRTLFLIFALFVITFVLLMVAIYQPTTPKITQTSIPKEPVAQTILSFGAPSVATPSSASIVSYSLPINISTGTNKVTAVQLEMQYDPAILTNVSIAPDSFFANPNVLLNQIDFKAGRISYAFGVGLRDQGIAGKGIVANLTFSVSGTTPQKTAILFLPKTLVTAQGINESVLKEAMVGQFTIGKDNSTPTTPPAGGSNQ